MISSKTNHIACDQTGTEIIRARGIGDLYGQNRHVSWIIILQNKIAVVMSKNGGGGAELEDKHIKNRHWLNLTPDIVFLHDKKPKE